MQREMGGDQGRDRTRERQPERADRKSAGAGFTKEDLEVRRGVVTSRGQDSRTAVAPHRPLQSLPQDVSNVKILLNKERLPLTRQQRQNEQTLPAAP